MLLIKWHGYSMFPTSDRIDFYSRSTPLQGFMVVLKLELQLPLFRLNLTLVIIPALIDIELRYSLAGGRQ